MTPMAHISIGGPLTEAMALFSFPFPVSEREPERVKASGGRYDSVPARSIDRIGCLREQW